MVVEGIGRVDADSRTAPSLFALHYRGDAGGPTSSFGFSLGAFSGADSMTGHACTVSVRLGGEISEKPNVEAYSKRLNNRPALKKAWAT